MEKSIIPVSHQISSSSEPVGVAQFSYRNGFALWVSHDPPASTPLDTLQEKGIVKGSALDNTGVK